MPDDDGCQEEKSSVSGHSEAEDGEKSRKQGKKQGKRGRVFAFILYPESAPENWLEALLDLCLRGFVSPVHDMDTLADGSLKKPHYHIMLYFSGKKSREQVAELVGKVAGPTFNGYVEEVECPEAYSRYLCHLDNPEKALYRREDVRAFGGADYAVAASAPGDEAAVLAAMSEYVRAEGVTDVNDLIAVAQESGRHDWLLFISKRSYAVGLLIQGAKEKRWAAFRK